MDFFRGEKDESIHLRLRCRGIPKLEMYYKVKNNNNNNKGIASSLMENVHYLPL